MRTKPPEGIEPVPAAFYRFFREVLHENVQHFPFCPAMVKIILPKGCELTNYFYRDTPLPPYLPLPRFLLRGGLSLNARLLYALLLSRTQLSQRNGWVTEAGRVYVIYPIRQLAEDLGRSQRTVKVALAELEKAGLLERVRRGWNCANRLFLRLPEEVPLSASPEGKGCPSMVQKAAPSMVQDLPPNKNDTNIHDLSKNEGEASPLLLLGEFENIRLSEEDILRLRITHPLTYEDGIQRLSRYLAETGRQYQDHYTVLRRWLDEDQRRQRARDCAGLDDVPLP